MRSETQSRRPYTREVAKMEADLDRMRPLVVHVHGCAYFCSECGAESWHLKGTDVDTCKRGHHKPCQAVRPV